MAGYLRDYDYEPEYTTEELDERSRAAVTTSVLHLKTCIKFRKRNHRQKIKQHRLVCSHDRQMSPHGFGQQKMADVIFIIKHHFYLTSFITFINATKVY